MYTHENRLSEKVAASVAVASFQQTTGGDRPNRRPATVSCTPWNHPHRQEILVQSCLQYRVWACIYFKYTSHIILMKARSKTLSALRQKSFITFLGGRPTPRDSQIDATVRPRRCVTKCTARRQKKNSDIRYRHCTTPLANPPLQVHHA